MRIVDLFCGGGGSSSGFHEAGFETVYAVDQAYHCVRTFESNFGKVAYQKDISTLRGEKILNCIGAKPTLVTASPPCEPFTSANESRIKDAYMRLFDDPTGRLTIKAMSLLSDLDPSFFMIENVMGILEGENKKLLQEEMDYFGLGRAYFNVIDAEKWGVPSRRRRLLITNFKISSPRNNIVDVSKVINNLSKPNYPIDDELHYTIPINQKHENKLSNLKQGESLVYFRGSNSDKRNYIRLRYDEPAPVVMGKSRFFHPSEDRLLTPREVARLMTFPDNHRFLGSNTQILDMIGEAVPPKITCTIGKQIISKL